MAGSRRSPPTRAGAPAGVAERNRNTQIVAPSPSAVEDHAAAALRAARTSCSSARRRTGANSLKKGRAGAHTLTGSPPGNLFDLPPNPPVRAGAPRILDSGELSRGGCIRARTRRSGGRSDPPCPSVAFGTALLANRRSGERSNGRSHPPAAARPHARCPLTEPRPIVTTAKSEGPPGGRRRSRRGRTRWRAHPRQRLPATRDLRVTDGRPGPRP